MKILITLLLAILMSLLAELIGLYFPDAIRSIYWVFGGWWGMFYYWYVIDKEE